jgi:integrase
MAACGLRDHEVFFCEWTDEGLQVLKGKTGPRLVFEPLYPEWVEAWDLKNVVLPKIRDPDDLYAKQQLGTKVSRAFKRQGVPFTPYDLRHAFGFRASVTFELPVPTSAELMGHSAKVHLDRYHKHSKLRQNQEAVRRVMLRPDRPLAPILTDD